jgi:antitoxin (DNA-binding transcriptional repressor) of toxin-antitoxin stability system
MKHFSVAETKARLSEILDGVLAGEEVIITRRGKEIVRLNAIMPPKPSYSYDDLLAHLESMPTSNGSAVVEMRELERY